MIYGNDLTRMLTHNQKHSTRGERNDKHNSSINNDVGDVVVVVGVVRVYDGIAVVAIIVVPVIVVDGAVCCCQ